MKNQEPTKPSGSLEDLFRHHLAEAAVPPAPQVWEQVDNALLLAQNQTYRRRLRTTRWLAAASLLLATLAGTGWWESRDSRPADMAATPASQAGPAAGGPRAGDLQLRPLASNPAAAADLAAGAGVGKGRPQTQAANPAARPSSDLALGPAASASRFSDSQSPAQSAAGLGPAADARRARLAALAAAPLRRPNWLPAAEPPSAATSRSSAAAAFGLGIAGRRQGVTASAGNLAGTAARRAPGVPALAGNGAYNTELLPAATSPQPALPAANNPMALVPLNASLASLAQQTAPLPTPLPPLPAATPETPATAARRWRLGASLTAGLFQANLNFSRANAKPPYVYSPALGANSPVLTEAAAAEYRARQRPGLSQRLRLQASRHLRGHWSLETGLEVAQLESRSATSYIFTGEPVYDLGQSVRGGTRQAARARYRTAGLPLELRYANSAKTGFSVYGRAGVVVSAVLSARAEVDNNPEATRTHDLLSASTPYRRVLGSARGAAGVQFRPASHDYTLSLGPVAEGGLWSLNARPAQDFLSQNRPYSFGLEAGVEFGHSPKAQ